MSDKKLSVVFPLYQENENNFVLLWRNAPGTKIPWIRNWFGGKCEEWESVINCAIRETNEETDGYITIKQDTLTKLWDVIMEDKIITFFTLYLDNKIDIPDNSQMIDIQWFNIKDTERFLGEMLSGDDKVISELDLCISNKEIYIPFLINKTGDQKLWEQMKNIYS